MTTSVDTLEVAAPSKHLERSVSPAGRAIRRFWRTPPAMIGFGWIVILTFIAIFAPLLAPHDPAGLVGDRFAGPSRTHPLGTDDLGRDVLSRLLYATRVALRASVQIVATSAAIAVPLGLTAGYLGGKLDYFTMRIVDAMNSIPPLIFALAIAGILGAGLGNAMIAVSVIFIPGQLRLIRGQALAVREETFVEASRVIGTRTPIILMRRILPNVASPLIVQLSILLGAALLVEAGLSFLGFGVQPPQASWGGMLRRAYDSIFTHPWQMVAPGVAISLAVLSWNLVGDGLRDAMGHRVNRGPRELRKGARLGLTSVRSSSEPAMPISADTLLSVRELEITFATESGLVKVVDNVSFDVDAGEVVGLVGESGCGKSMTSLGIMRLISTPPAYISGGAVNFAGMDLLALSSKQMSRVRGDDIAMIFQDPMASLNPAFTVGNQLVEALQLHTDLNDRAARRRAIDLLEMVEIAAPSVRMGEYPHQLSGGMRQRVVIAQALACKPRLLIADEPTTALDVTIQEGILDLIKSLQRELKMAVIFVTHDLGVVADICERVIVMYAGQIIEQGSVQRIFDRPTHPYTAALLSAMPQLGTVGEPLTSIPGIVPTPGHMPPGCRFAPRCAHRRDECEASLVNLTGRPLFDESRCIRSLELAEELTIR